MKLATSTWKEVETYLKTRKDLVFPTGSVEQHGPTGFLGTDFLTAAAVSEEVERKTGVAVAAPLCYGMSSHHMGFPGSSTLRPSIYQAVLCELFRGWHAQGFRRFAVVNGHGGNTLSIKAAFQELKHEGLEDAEFSVFDWWKTPEMEALARELFGDSEGSHATPSEISLTFHLHGIDRRDYPGGPARKGSRWPVTASEFRADYPDGVVGADPGLARAEYGARILSVAAAPVIQHLRGNGV